MQKHR